MEQWNEIKERIGSQIGQVLMISRQVSRSGDKSGRGRDAST